MSTPTRHPVPHPATVPTPGGRSAPPRGEPIAQPLRPLHRTDVLPARRPSTSQPRRGTIQEFTHHPEAHAEIRAADPTPVLPLGDPTALCCAVAHAAMESLRGIRPLAQLVRSVSPEVFDALYTRCQVREQARTRPGAPPVSQSRARVRHARVIRIAPGVAEASVVVDDVDRVRAVALRVEERRGRWRVVVLEIG